MNDESEYVLWWSKHLTGLAKSPHRRLAWWASEDQNGPTLVLSGFLAFPISLNGLADLGLDLPGARGFSAGLGWPGKCISATLVPACKLSLQLHLGTCYPSENSRFMCEHPWKNDAQARVHVHIFQVKQKCSQIYLWFFFIFYFLKIWVRAVTCPKKMKNKEQKNKTKWRSCNLILVHACSLSLSLSLLF